MHYIKLGLWIFILTLIYATGMLNICGFYPELLFLFAVIYSPVAKSFKERIFVLLICGIFMSSFGGYGFIFSVLLTAYTGFLFGVIFRGKLFKYNIVMILAVMAVTFLYEGIASFDALGFDTAIFHSIIPAVLINGIVAGILRPLIKKSFEKKERYIF